MAIKYFGRATRNFIIGTRLCPPAKSLASSPCCCKSAIASPIPLGARYSKAAGYILCCWPESHLAFVFQRGEIFLGKFPLDLPFRVFVAHRIPFARADFFISLFDEGKIVDVIQCHRTLNAAESPDCLHLLA